jgi:uncharacterized protein (DUF4415 family)
MSITTPKRALRTPAVAQNTQIRSAAKFDPDAQPLTTAQLKAMVPLKTVLGRPKSSSKKQLLSVRYSPEVIDYFRSTGDGWQARMDGVLLTHVNKQTATRRTRKAS